MAAAQNNSSAAGGISDALGGSIVNGAASVINGTVGAGFHYGEVKLQTKAATQQAYLQQTTDIAGQGWDAIGNLSNSVNGLNQALINKYSNSQGGLFGSSNPFSNNNYIWVALVAAAAIVVLAITLK